MKDLKHKVIRGGFAKALAQGASLVVRMGSLMILARLLAPWDFGLVGMVTAFTGVLNLFRDFGLSTATVQRGDVTQDQVSTLFWINMLVGVVLAMILAGMAPFVAVFYHEPRLVWVSIALAGSFIFNAAGVQHTALLERQMRFTALATIDIISLVVGTGIGIGMAASGFGYWSLVASAISLPFVTTVCLWVTTKWTPRMPSLPEGLRSLLRFGGAITLGNVIVYFGYNLEKVLLGRFWGADALGIYGRAYQLITIPGDNLQSAFWGLAFSGLSRVRNDPQKFRSYFLKGYSLLLAITIPIGIAAALLAPDLILVVLGPKWTDVILIFRLLTPTILVLAVINPLSWVLFSLGLVGRNLKIVMVLAPLVIVGYAMGLPYGPKGVALGYSAMMLLWAIPDVAWCLHGTPISLRDVLLTASRPFVSCITGAALVFGVQFLVGQYLSPLPRLILGTIVFFGAYAGMLLYGMGQKAFYLGLFRGLTGRGLEENVMVSA